MKMHDFRPQNHLTAGAFGGLRLPLVPHQGIDRGLGGPQAPRRPPPPPITPHPGSASALVSCNLLISGYGNGISDKESFLIRVD